MPGARDHQGHPSRGADRFHRSVLPPDQSHLTAAGHTGKVTRRRWLAEMALRPSSRTGASYPAGRVVMSNGPLRRCWRVIVDFDYVLTLVGPVLDAPAGPATETRPDQQRAQDRGRIKRAFPKIKR